MAESREPMRFQEREDRVRAKAQELWEKEGRPEGMADQHWYRAAMDIDRELEAETESINGGGDCTASGTRHPPDQAGLALSAPDTLSKQTELERHQDRQAQQGQNHEKQSQQSTTPEKDRYPGKPQRNEDSDVDPKRSRESLGNTTPRA